ncbi:hypothetical protein FQY83_08555 [Luteimonas marina]|uniref:Uncharacterized protein n=1 Tax=Luteimonas marina TaxID=488485 RepID=A0A5C5U6C7_9GAMM|nr:hypothetical protein FQY83_08555 [Luteimonas marina]
MGPGARRCKRSGRTQRPGSRTVVRRRSIRTADVPPRGSRRPREGGDPVSFILARAKTLGPRLRGDDGFCAVDGRNAGVAVPFRTPEQATRPRRPSARPAGSGRSGRDRTCARSPTRPPPPC